MTTHPTHRAPFSISLTLAATLLTAGAVAGAPPLAGWFLDEGTGAATDDAWGSNDGELQGGMAVTGWTSEVPIAYAGNAALTFDGVNDRVLVNDHGVVCTRDSSSVAAWFRWDDPIATKQFTIYAERDECSFNVYWLGIEKRVGVPHGLAFSVFDRTPGMCGLGSWQNMTAPVTGILLDEWHHVVAVLDEVEGMSLYLDGELVASDPDATASYSGATGVTTIGHAHTPTYNGWWSGELDEIAVFEQALTAEQAVSLYENGLASLECSADLDETGDVGFGDLTALLLEWGPCDAPPAECPADLDGSGDVGFGDLTALLLDWGSCP